MAYTEILTSHSLTVSEWDDQLFKTYLGQLWWKNMTGTSLDSVIQVKEDLVKKPGDAITVGVRGLLQGGKVVGNNLGVGNAGSVQFYGQRIVIDNVRFVVEVRDLPMTQKRVGWDVLSNIKEELARKAQLDLDEEITRQLSDTTTGRVRGRYLYGAKDSNWNATHTTALTNIANATDQFTTNMIRIAKRKALIPINADNTKMLPMRIVTGKNFEEWYVIVAHPYCTRDMFDSDPAWKNAQLNIPPHDNDDSPIFTGSAFKGAYDGTLIYEYERINLVSSTIQTAVNLFLGAQAGAVVWGQRAKFNEEFADLNHRVTYESHEIRGVQKLFFTRLNQMDQGIVHVFAAAVAD